MVMGCLAVVATIAAAIGSRKVIVRFVQRHQAAILSRQSLVADTHELHGHSK